VTENERPRVSERKSFKRKTGKQTTLRLKGKGQKKPGGRKSSQRFLRKAEVEANLKKRKHAQPYKKKKT